MPATRRELVAALGVALGSAGCVSTPSRRSDGATATSPATSSTESRQVSMGTTVTVSGTSVTVENPRVRKAVVTPGMAHTRVVANAGQFVVVDIAVDGATPDQPFDREFRSAVDGETRDGSDPLPTTDAGGYAFALPATRHDRGAIQWATDETDVYWTLPRAVLGSLAVEPIFSVTAFRVPHRDGERVLELTVANEGERDGHFAARASFDGYSGGSIVEFPVPAGESETYTGRPGDVLLYFENHGGETLTVEYPADEGLRSIERTVSSSATEE